MMYRGFGRLGGARSSRGDEEYRYNHTLIGKCGAKGNTFGETKEKHCSIPARRKRTTAIRLVRPCGCQRKLSEARFRPTHSSKGWVQVPH